MRRRRTWSGSSPIWGVVSKCWTVELLFSGWSVGILSLLCCVAVTAPAFTYLSYSEALESFFVEVAAFCIVP